MSVLSKIAASVLFFALAAGSAWSQISTGTIVGTVKDSSGGVVPNANVTLTTFASIPRHLPQCPGGIGLTTAMAMLKSGWVIVGSLLREDGTTATKGPGCLVVLDSDSHPRCARC